MVTSLTVVVVDGGHFHHPGQILSEVAYGSKVDPEGLYVVGLDERLQDDIVDCEP